MKKYYPYTVKLSDMTSYLAGKNIIILLVFLMLASTRGHAQQFRTLYWMQGIPQASYGNPGLQPNPTFYVGLPGISSLYFGFDNSGFALRDVLSKNAQNRLFIDDQSLISALKNHNYTGADFQNELITLGFRMDQNYFSMNISERVETRFGYPLDFMKLMVNGNDYFMQQDIAAQLGGLGLDFTHFREIGFGFSRNWTEELTAGARLKFLQGMGSVNFEKWDLDLYTAPKGYDLLLQADLLVNTSLPIDLAPLEGIEDRDFELSEEEMRNYLTDFGNPGFAIDLGGFYQINEQFSVAASLRDLGFISWTSKVENFALYNEFEFSGFEFDSYFDDENNDDPFQEDMDSIIDTFDVIETQNAYTTMLPAKIFISGAYNLTSMHKFALLGRGEFYAGKFYPSATASYNFQPIPQFGTSLSYSVIHANFHNLGFGFHANFGPVQLYAVVDNLLGSMQPHLVQTANIHFGINIVSMHRRQDARKPSLRW